MGELLEKISKLKDLLFEMEKKGIKLEEKPDIAKSLHNYKEKKNSYYIGCFEAKCNEIRRLIIQAVSSSPDSSAVELLSLWKELEKESTNLKKVNELLNKIEQIAVKVKTPAKGQKQAALSFKVNFIPAEIKSNILADLNEIQKCFENGFYRSATILCGRVLETALHRKYYEATGNDLLEKSPGIGLGNLIAKMKEKNMDIDPALAQQVHLINQVRIFSVHTKKEAFIPSPEQAHAIILYTIDILNKLWSRK